MLEFHLLLQDSCSSFLTILAYKGHFKKKKKRVKSGWPESTQSQRHFKVLSSIQTIPKLQQGDLLLKNNKAMCELSILYLTSIKDYTTCIIQLNKLS